MTDILVLIAVFAVWLETFVRFTSYESITQHSFASVRTQTFFLTCLSCACQNMFDS